MATTAPPTATLPPPPPAHGGILGRQLDRYPDNARRALYLGIVVVATIVLYYELYIQGSVATRVIADLHMTLTYFIMISVVGNAVGALGSLAAGLADRWGRANLVVAGLLITGLLIAVGLPAASNKTVYLVLFALVSVVEGVILVATPALIRDFSPQLGRASAMGFWTLGPVMGSLVCTEVSSHTLDAHPDWQYQFRVCGIVGLIVFALAFVLLRELSPGLRDQLMVSLHDRELIEAKAANLDPEKALEGQWKQMLKLDVVGSAFAISIFLLFYYIAAGFFVIYFATTFGYSPARANSLANWYWISNAIALIVAGVVSDFVGVRKPFMILGAVISATGVAIFATYTTKPETGYYTFVWTILLVAIGSAITFANWMAGFTETVEKHNPAATATGLAVWGSTIRTVITVALIGLIFAVSANATLIDGSGRATALQKQYATELATLQKLSPATAAALAKNPKDPAAGVAAASEVGGVSQADVVRAATLGTQYAAELATLKKLTPAHAAALQAAPTSTAAQVAALSDISGVSAADVARAVTLSTTYAVGLKAAAALDTPTATALVLDPTNTTNLQKAVGEVMSGLGVTAAVAQADLAALAKIPAADLAFLSTNDVGKKVTAAAVDLSAAGKIPAADLAFLSTTGAKVQAASDSLTAAGKIPAADLAFLQKLQKVQKVDSPRQWKRWWWICFGAQLVFIPFVFLMTGRWSPKAAKRDAEEHEVAVAAELARMQLV